MAQCKLAGVGTAAAVARQQPVDHRGLSAEAREHGQVEIPGDARLAPMLQRDAANEAKGPSAVQEKPLEGLRLVEQLDHRVSCWK